MFPLWPVWADSWCVLAPRLFISARSSAESRADKHADDQNREHGGQYPALRPLHVTQPTRRPAGQFASRAGAPATNSGMRLFVAILPPPSALDELEAAAAPLRPAWPGLRWTGHEAWHLTLAFLGEVGEVPAARLRPRLERAASRHPNLGLSFSGAGAFPGEARARVLWTGVRGDRRALAGLAESVGAGARRAGAPPVGENRRFRPHLTLARARIPSDVRPLVDALKEFAGEQWMADKIHLIRSHTGPRPRYETLGSWPLRGQRSRGTAEPAG